MAFVSVFAFAVEVIIGFLQRLRDFATKPKRTMVNLSYIGPSSVLLNKIKVLRLNTFV